MLALFKHVKIHLDNRTKSYNPCEALVEAFRGKLWQKYAFWKADFRERKKQSMQGNSIFLNKKNF